MPNGFGWEPLGAHPDHFFNPSKRYVVREGLRGFLARAADPARLNGTPSKAVAYPWQLLEAAESDPEK